MEGTEFATEMIAEELADRRGERAAAEEQKRATGEIKNGAGRIQAFVVYIEGVERSRNLYC